MGSRGKSRGLLAIDDHRNGRSFRSGQVRGKLFEIVQHLRTQFVSWRIVQRQFEHALFQMPGKGLAAMVGHASFRRYISSMAPRKCAAMASRRNLPMAVSSPLSMVRGCGSM